MKDRKSSPLEISENICYKCGQKLINENVSVEHFLPISFGGSADLTNLRLICRKCNDRYRNLYFSEYEFEKFIFEILIRRNDFKNVVLNKKISKGYVIDIVAKRKKLNVFKKLAIEIKQVTSLTTNRIYSIIDYFKEIRKISDDDLNCVLVFPGNLTQSSKMILKRNHIEIWDEDYLMSEFKKEIIEIDHPIFRLWFNQSYKNVQCREEKFFIDELKNVKLVKKIGVNIRN